MPCQPGGQRRAGDAGHHDVGHRGDGARLQHRHDAGVIEVRRRLDVAVEPEGQGRVGQHAGLRHLQRDATAHLRIVGEKNEEYPTPLDATAKDPVYVGRIRKDTSNPEKGLSMWVVADNLRIGAALNAVRIAEVLVQKGWVKSQAKQVAAV